MTTPITQTTTTAPQTLPSADESSSMESNVDTLQNAQLKDNSPNSTSLMRRTAKIAAQVTVGLVAIPLMVATLVVSNIFLNPFIIYKSMYYKMCKNVPEDSKVTKYIFAATVAPIATVTITLFLSFSEIYYGIKSGITIAKDLSLDPCKEAVQMYKNGFNIALNPLLFYDEKGNLLIK